MTPVFISYTHDSEEHRSRVRNLAERLRADGVTVVLDSDLPGQGPDEGWPKWSELHAAHSARILSVFTHGYRSCWDGVQPPGFRLGGTAETAVISQRVHECGQNVAFLRVVIFDESDRAFIPARIKGLKSFHGKADYNELCSWLKGDDSPTKAGSGAIRWVGNHEGFDWSLANRSAEFERVQQMLRGESAARILLAEAPSSMGKSMLLGELRRYARHVAIPHAFIELKGSPTFDEVLFVLQRDLDPETLGPARNGKGKGTLFSFLLHLKELRRPLLLILDAYEKASGDVRDWTEQQLLTTLESAPAVSVVIGGQSVPQRARALWEGLATHVHLSAIEDAQEWLRYASRRWPVLSRAQIRGAAYGKQPAE